MKMPRLVRWLGRALSATARIFAPSNASPKDLSHAQQDVLLEARRRVYDSGGFHLRYRHRAGDSWVTPCTPGLDHPRLYPYLDDAVADAKAFEGPRETTCCVFLENNIVWHPLGPKYMTRGGYFRELYEIGALGLDGKWTVAFASEQLTRRGPVH